MTNAKGYSGRTLWGIHGGLVLQHYDQFDSKYKGMMPLKRVYVPEPLEDLET